MTLVASRSCLAQGRPAPCPAFLLFGQREARMRCQNCGSFLATEAGCPSCGVRNSALPRGSVEPEWVKESRAKKWVGVAFAFLIGAGLLGGSPLMFRERDREA